MRQTVRYVNFCNKASDKPRNVIKLEFIRDIIHLGTSLVCKIVSTV